MPARDTKGPDTDRLGLFRESSYISVGDPYKDPRVQFNAKASKGKQMLSGSRKLEDTQKFPRLFEGEAATDKGKLRRKQELKAKSKMVGGTFMPSGATKKLSNPGSYVGTFSGRVEYVSPKARAAPKKAKEPRNFLSSPPKKGSFGVPGTTLGEPAFLLGDKYGAAQQKAKKDAKLERAKMKGGAFKTVAAAHPGTFGPNPFAPPKKAVKSRKRSTPSKKKPPVPFYPTRGPGDMKGTGKFLGALNKYPEYKPEKPKAKPPKKPEKVFRPTQPAKSMVTRSVSQMNIDRRVSARTYSNISTTNTPLS
eukprot:m.484500 g.484500  ORF g.484500 m.484500 type:complete len:307 (-) comp23379_c0_seq1:139-1059(-)